MKGLRSVPWLRLLALRCAKWIAVGASVSWIVSLAHAAWWPTKPTHLLRVTWPNGHSECYQVSREVAVAATARSASAAGAELQHVTRPPPFRSLRDLVDLLRPGLSEPMHRNTPRFSQEDYHADVYGWPCASFGILYSRRSVFEGVTGVIESSARLACGIRLPGIRPELRPDSVPRALPLLPWHGLLISAPLYGSICWLVSVGCRRVRGGERLRRNRCPDCGHPLVPQPNASKGCPECGWRIAGESALRRRPE